MIKKKITNKVAQATEDFHKLSIQVSLNGLSFCVIDTITNSLLVSDSIIFEKEQNPFETEKHLKLLLEQHNITRRKFSEVIVIHTSTLFSLVPKALFDEKELANYLKFNAKILTNDHIAYDEIEHYDIVNVYVPLTNINNYIFDLFGVFEFQHNGTVLINTLLNGQHSGKNPTCYVYVGEKRMDITVVSQKKLLLYNSYAFNTKEDFIYYLLFTMEQLQLDTDNISLKLFGAVEEDDDLYEICYRYIKHIAIFVPPSSISVLSDTKNDTIDFTTLNTL